MYDRAGLPLPYYVAPGPASPNRILLISYHAPPSNEVGALRWAGMAGHLATRGWGLDIIAVDPVALPNRSDAQLQTLPPGTRLYGVPDPAPVLDRVVDGAARLRQRIRRKLHITAPAPAGAVLAAPAVQRGWSVRDGMNAFHAWREYVGGGRWARRAAEVGRRIFDERVHRWVASSGPPQMSHEGGRLLSVWTGLPFIADFRDPWRFSEWVSLGPAWLRFAERYEPRVVARSALTIVNVEPVRLVMQRAYPDARIVTITNGVDEGPALEPDPTRKFIIGYAGGLYLGRDPEPLFEAVGGMVRELDLTPADLGLEFMGFFDSHLQTRLRGLAAKHRVESYLAIHPGQPRAQAQEFMRGCAVLVALQQGSDLAIPAKLFEFLRFPSWLLILAGPRSATAELLAGTDADVYDSPDVLGIQTALAARFRMFREGGRPRPLGSQERFSRRFQAGLLVEAMDAAGR